MIGRKVEPIDHLDWMPSFQWLAVKCKGRQGSTNICLSFWYGIQHLKVAGGPRSLSGLHDSKPESRIAYKTHANNYTLRKEYVFFQNRRLEDHHFFSCPGGFSKSFLLQRRAKLNGMVAATCRQAAVGWTLVATKRDEFWSSPLWKERQKTQMPSGSLSTIELAFQIFHNSFIFPWDMQHFSAMFWLCWFARAHFAQWSQAW